MLQVDTSFPDNQITSNIFPLDIRRIKLSLLSRSFELVTISGQGNVLIFDVDVSNIKKCVKVYSFVCFELFSSECISPYFGLAIQSLSSCLRSVNTEVANARVVNFYT